MTDKIQKMYHQNFFMLGHNQNMWIREASHLDIYGIVWLWTHGPWHNLEL